jgi:hypothetical protein
LKSRRCRDLSRLTGLEKTTGASQAKMHFMVPILPGVCAEPAVTRALWRRRIQHYFWPPRPGIGALLIAVLFPIFGIMTASAQAANQSIWPPEWVWYGIVFVLVFLEFFLIQREGKLRDDTVNRTTDAIAGIIDRTEAAMLVSRLLAEIPKRQVVADLYQSDKYKKIVSLALRLVRFAEDRLAVQPRFNPYHEEHNEKALLGWIMDTVATYGNEFDDQIVEARKALAKDGRVGTDYEEAAYDEYYFIANMLRIADLQSRLAIAVPLKYESVD